MENKISLETKPLLDIKLIVMSNRVMSSAMSLILSDREGICIHVPTDLVNPLAGVVKFLVYRSNGTINIEPSSIAMNHGQTFTLNKQILN